MKPTGRAIRKNRRQLLMLALALTIGLGLMGSAAAMWSDGTSIFQKTDTGILTGKIIFSKVYVEDGQDQGEISTTFEDNDFGSDNYRHEIYVTIDGVQYTTNWTLDTKIVNLGTIPVRFLTDFDENPPVITTDPELEVSYYLAQEVIDPVERSGQTQELEGRLELRLISDQPGTYQFQIKLPCIQWNAYNNDPSYDWWQDTLYIMGDVTVAAPELKDASGTTAAESTEAAVGYVCRTE